MFAKNGQVPENDGFSRPMSWFGAFLAVLAWLPPLGPRQNGARGGSLRTKDHKDGLSRTTARLRTAVRADRDGLRCIGFAQPLTGVSRCTLIHIEGRAKPRRQTSPDLSLQTERHMTCISNNAQPTVPGDPSHSITDGQFRRRGKPHVSFVSCPPARNGEALPRSAGGGHRYRCYLLHPSYPLTMW